MDKEKVASELVKMAKELVASNWRQRENVISQKSLRAVLSDYHALLVEMKEAEEITEAEYQKALRGVYGAADALRDAVRDVM